MALMTDRLNLLPRHRKELEALLRKHVPDAEVWAYGSRVNGWSHEASDLDLALRGPNLEPLGNEYAELVGALEQSNIPILVQAHDWARLPESFHREIERDYVVVQGGEIQSQSGEWPQLVLGDVAEIIMGQSPSGDTVSDKHGLALLNGPTEFGTHHPIPVQFTTDVRKRAQPGDILFCVRGSTTGRMNWADQEYAIGRGVAAIRHREDPGLQPFVRGAIELELPALLNRATGSTFPNVSASQLAEITYPNLDMSEQRRIAHILGTLDDKIELNRRMNETLEAMARAIFQDWFVDFGPVRAKLEGREPYLPPELWDLFPDRMVDSELGEIPEGWEVKALGEVCNLNPESWSRTNCPVHVEYVDLANTKWGVIGSTQYFAWKDAPSRAKRVLRTGDTVVGTVRPSNGSYSLIGNDGLTGSTAFAVLRPSCPRFRELVYLSATALDNIERLAHRADGGAYPAVRPEIVSETEVAIPTDESRVLDWFSKTVGPVLDKMESVKAESRALAAQRDMLLPKLVGGALRA